MPVTGNGPVQLLDIDPELGRDLDPIRAREASQRLIVRSIEVGRGTWSPAATFPRGTRLAGLLIIDGLLLRETTVGLHPCAELLGTGDMLRTLGEEDTEPLLPRSVQWNALTTTQLALIDHAFIVQASQWPEIFAALIERTNRRAERLAIMHAIGQLTRVDDRLLALMWCLAERWGKVSPEGVVINLRLPHRTLANMIGARRPSVTTALGQLMAQGAIERRGDGAWLLHADPPEYGETPTSGAAIISAAGVTS
jgi:CRP-like cAMP-binding protein